MVRFYARHELINIPGAGDFEAPQYADLRYLMPGAPEEDIKFYHHYNYNETLKRYESSVHTLAMLGEARTSAAWDPNAPERPESDWERLSTTLCRRFGVDLRQWRDNVPEFAVDVLPDVPSACGDVQFDESGIGGAVDFNMQTEVFFLIDKAVSMGQIAPGDFDVTRSRLDSAKNAAREFFNGMTLGLGLGEAGPRVGLMYYFVTARAWRSSMRSKRSKRCRTHTTGRFSLISPHSTSLLTRA